MTSSVEAVGDNDPTLADILNNLLLIETENFGCLRSIRINPKAITLARDATVIVEDVSITIIYLDYFSVLSYRCHQQMEGITLSLLIFGMIGLIESLRNWNTWHTNMRG
jgi:hypothetical protein